MKKIIYSLLMCLSLISLSSCEDEMHDDSRVTYYASIDLTKGSYIAWPHSTKFVEPGYSAEMKGENVTDQVIIDGTVNVDKIGMYKLTYSMINADGFPASAVRNVMVYDPTTSAITSAAWSTSAASYRNSAGTVTSYGANFIIPIYQIAPGEFYCGDFLGGWYDQRAGYGSAYAAVGSFKLNDDNTITLIDSSVEGWGDSLDALVDGKYDPSTGEISWCAQYAGMNFYVTMTL